MWKQKFGSKAQPAVVDGECDSKIIADNFSNYFSSVCCPNNLARHKQLEARFINEKNCYKGDSLCTIEPISVELVDNLLSNMKTGKAAGVDGIVIEHIKHSHPIVVVFYQSYSI